MVERTNCDFFVVGSTTTLAPALEAMADEGHAVFLGRSNPHELRQWQRIHSLEDEHGIEQACTLLSETTLELGRKAAHLVLLQGVSTKDWRQSINVNMLSVACMAESFARVNRERKAVGSIALLGSATSYLGGKLPYAATKASLTGVMNALNSKYGSETRTNLIVPGVFEGAMTANWGEAKRGVVLQKTFARRMATPQEVVDAIMFCAGNEYVAGSVINMTSGQIGIE